MIGLDGMAWRPERLDQASSQEDVKYHALQTLQGWSNAQAYDVVRVRVCNSRMQHERTAWLSACGQMSGTAPHAAGMR